MSFLLKTLISGFSLPVLSLPWLTLFLVAVITLLWYLDYKYGFSERSWGRRSDNSGLGSMRRFHKDPSMLPLPPTPLPLPFLGHLHLLAPYPTNPWEGFDAIRSKYGNVVRLRLGQFPSVLVSSPEAIKEVLLTKGELFSDRPHFERHAKIFGRNRQNSIALCDWSKIHRVRRSITHAAAIPRFGSDAHDRFASSIHSNIDKVLTTLDSGSLMSLNKSVALKLSAAIFIEFLLETKIDELEEEFFDDLCSRYDFIFHDINQMYLCDFLPYLAPITSRTYLKDVELNASTTLDFVHSMVIPRFLEIRRIKELEKESEIKSADKETDKENDKQLENEYDSKSCEERFVNKNLLHKQYASKAQFMDFIIEYFLDNQDTISWDECLYTIADLIGGSSAVGNLLYRLLGFVALNPEVQEELYNEAKTVVDQSKSNTITIDDQPQMPLTFAAVFETLRFASSPIIPHLARVDTSIQDHFIPKGTMVLFNLYRSNFSETLWHDPQAFKPSRFVTAERTVMKPDYFIPYSHGRRSCLGYKMVNTVTFACAANIILHFKLRPINESKIKEMLKTNGSISLPSDGSCFEIAMEKRKF